MVVWMNAVFVYDGWSDYLSMYSSVLCLLKEICDLTYYYVELEQVITNQAIKFTTLKYHSIFQLKETLHCIGVLNVQTQTVWLMNGLFLSFSIMHMEMLGACLMEQTLHCVSWRMLEVTPVYLFCFQFLIFNLVSGFPHWDPYLILVYQQYKWLTLMCLNFS